MKKIIAPTIVLLFLLPAWAGASMASRQPFSADIHYQPPGERDRMVMRAYFSNDRIRIDRGRGKLSGGIIRFDQNVIWVLDHRRHLYWELALAPTPVIHLLDLDGTTLHRAKLGRARQNGVACEKMRVRYEDPVSGRPQVVTAWFGIDQGVYVRIEKADGTVYNMRNIRMGPQPDRHFAAPGNYRLRQPGPAPGHQSGLDQRAANYGPPWYGRAPGHTARPGRPDMRGVPVLSDGRLFPNSDFEDGTLHNWTAKGAAFRYQPTKADNPRARHSKQPSRHQNSYWIGTYEKYGARLRERPGQVQGNRPTGSLTSIPFDVTHERIDFLIGGGNRASEVYVALSINGRTVRRATGRNIESLRQVSWNVGQYAGRKARIVIVDKGTGHWGHINADDFRYAGRAMVEVRYIRAPRARRTSSEGP